MRISEFCNTFQISHQAVYAKIKKYADELEGHISKDKGNVLDLDPFAVNLLKPKKASYKALDERNYYLFKKNKEIVSENESIRAERDELASKRFDYRVSQKRKQGICRLGCPSYAGVRTLQEGKCRCEGSV